MMRNKKKIVTLLTGRRHSKRGLCHRRYVGGVRKLGRRIGRGATGRGGNHVRRASWRNLRVAGGGAVGHRKVRQGLRPVETALGRFTAVDREGYTVTLSSGEKKNIKVVDISAPVIVTSYSVRYVSVGDEIETPEVTVDDEYKTKDVSFTAGWYCNGEATEDTVFAAGRYEYQDRSDGRSGKQAEKDGRVQGRGRRASPRYRTLFRRRMRRGADCQS